jgi:hypothetical protein
MALIDFRAVYLPYCIKRQEDGTLLVLNREYAPLSFNTYDDSYRTPSRDLPVYSKIDDFTPEFVEELKRNFPGVSTQDDGNTIFLYNDFMNPLHEENRENYFAILDKLLGLRVRL